MFWLRLKGLNVPGTLVSLIYGSGLQVGSSSSNVTKSIYICLSVQENYRGKNIRIINHSYYTCTCHYKLFNKGSLEIGIRKYHNTEYRPAF